MFRLACFAALVASTLFTFSPDAQACGGCFSPPPGAPGRAQVVTDHRMVLALSQRETTLWDQIQYSGSPEDFVWVLPVANAATLRMGLADNNFVNALDEFTAPYVTYDPPACTGYSRPRVDGGLLFGCASESAGLNWTPGAGSESTRVMRDGEEVVGPYAVTVVGTKSGGGQLDTWLESHGYQIPAATRSVIAHYIDIQFDFIVLRLRPGTGVHQMQPVRITTRGYSPVLPLRMIAAGVADKVGLSLMVAADSRMEAHGFANVSVQARDLTFDYRSGRSNWRTAFDTTLRRAGQNAWITESVQNMQPSFLEYDIGTLPPPAPGFDGGSDVIPSSMLEDSSAPDVFGDATSMQPADATTPFDRYVDRRYLFAGLGSRAVVTRMRTELARVALDRDLVLDAAETDDPISVEYVAASVTNAPVCNSPGGRGCAVVTATTSTALEVLFVAAVVARFRKRRADRLNACERIKP
jgi:hypothetical protein